MIVELHLGLGPALAGQLNGQLMVVEFHHCLGPAGGQLVVDDFVQHDVEENPGKCFRSCSSAKENYYFSISA